MADNVAITAGSGTTIATDDVAGVQYQRVKLDFGADGATSPATLANPLPVQVTDSVVTSTTEYPEDSAHVSGDSGNLVLAVRSDTAAALAGTDGDYIPLITDSSGRLHVNVGNIAAGTNAIGKLAANSGVDIGDVDITSVIPGTTATSLGKAEDAAHSSGDTGVMALGVRVDSAAALAGTDGDYTPLQTNATGALRVEVTSVAANSSVKQDDAAFTPATDYVAVIGATADETSTDSVNEGDAGALRMTLDRKLIVTPQPHTQDGLSIFRSLDLDETEEDVKTTPGQIYAVWFTNTSTVTHWLKFYNGIASGVTVGTTTPVITIGLPGNTSDDISGSFSGMSTHGISFSSGICAAVTTGLADNDTGAPTTNAVQVNVFYK